MEKNTTENSQITKKVFFCEKCDYNCFRSSDFKKHLQSIKHNTTKYNQKFSIFVHAVKHFLIEDHYITINGLVNI
jgi:hypothetical protein